MGRHSLCRGRQAPELPQRNQRPEGPTQQDAQSLLDLCRPFRPLVHEGPNSGGSRHRQRLCRPSRPESHSNRFNFLCFHCPKSLTALGEGDRTRDASLSRVLQCIPRDIYFHTMCRMVLRVSSPTFSITRQLLLSLSVIQRRSSLR